MKKYRMFATALIALLLVGGGYCGYRFIKHERSQSSAINDLRGQIAVISAKLEEDNDEAHSFIDGVSDESFDYLAIGNSITKHPITDFWWGEWGMAASDADHDYYHFVVDGIVQSGKQVNSVSFNFIPWELNSHDRAEAFALLEPYLTLGIDLITIQLSENCNDLSTFDMDLEELIQYCRDKCGPETRVVVIDDFWDEEKHDIKIKVCEKTKTDFVDLSDLRGNDKYVVGMRKIVYGEDGEQHIIEHEGVAKHPGDVGMRAISHKVLEVILD